MAVSTQVVILEIFLEAIVIKVRVKLCLSEQNTGTGQESIRLFPHKQRHFWPC